MLSASLFPRLVVRFLFALLLGMAVSFAPGCGGSGGEDDGGTGPSSGNVTLLAPKSALTDVTGEPNFRASVLLTVQDGRVLIVDSISQSVVLVDQAGFVSLFTESADMLDLTEEASVVLGPMDQVALGALTGRVFSADSISGNIMLLDVDGTPSIFSSEVEILRITLQQSFKMSLPRELTNSQYMAQDLVTRDILRFDVVGTAFPFVSAGLLATATNLPVSSTYISGWAYAPVSKSYFARFALTSTVVQILTTGQVGTYVSKLALENLLPDIVDLRVLDMVTDVTTDNLLLLIGEGARGISLVLVSAVGQNLSVFTSQDELEAIAGATVDLSDILVTPAGAAVAIDRGGAQVLGFSDGVPVVFGHKDDIEAVTGVTDPIISIGANIAGGGIMVPEDKSQSLVLVR